MNMGGSRRQASPSRLMKPDGRWNESGSGGLARTLDRLFSTVLFPPFSSNQLKPDGRWDEFCSNPRQTFLHCAFSSVSSLPSWDWEDVFTFKCPLKSLEARGSIRWVWVKPQTEDPSPTLEDTRADRHLFPVFKKKIIGEKEDKRKQPTTTPNGRYSIKFT